MLEVLGLGPDVIAGGIVGLVMLGVVARQVLLGWREARSDVNKALSPIATAMSLTWDRDQVERAIQALETIAESQAILADRFQQTTHSLLNEMMEKLDHVENPNARPRPPRRR